MINRKRDDGISIGAKELAKLRQAMRDSATALRQYRENIRTLYKELAGKWYNESGAAAPVNFIELLDNVFMRNLITSTPRCHIRARRREQMPQTARLRVAVNALSDRIGLGGELQSCAHDALYGAGYMNIDTEPAVVNIGGERRLHSTPYASRFSGDDFCIDPDATTWRNAEFIGRRVYVDWEQLKRSKLYTLPAEVQPDEELGGHDDRASDISKSNAGNAEPYRRKIGLWSLWLPRKNAIVTVADKYETHVLRKERWIGPVEGPVHMLGFGTVPDQIMPRSPMAALVDLHVAGNVLFSKILNDCKDSKTIYAAQAAALADANRIIAAKHGDVIPMMDSNAVKEMRFGGPESQTVAMFLSVKELFSWAAGNMDMMGGLGPQSPTATQDQMLMSSASKRIAAMQQQMRQFTAVALRHLAWYSWNDPLLYAVGTRDVPGLGQRTIEVTAADFANAGDFFDYEFDVEANSLIRKSPAERAQLAIQFATQILIPLAPMMQQSGQGIDFNALIRMFAETEDVPELLDILQTEIVPPAQSDESPARATTRMPQTTERRYVRTTNRSGATPTSGASAVIAALAGRGGENNRRGVA